MEIGVPKEVNNHEFQVAITPAGVSEQVQHGHDVSVQTGADLGSPISGDEYAAAGSALLDHADDV
jgi:alanine dehydrogenase